MVTKIYLNYPLKRVPLNGLVRFNGIFYRRRTCNAGRIITATFINDGVSNYGNR